jgi:carboxymethylenebutenolidase
VRAQSIRFPSYDGEVDAHLALTGGKHGSGMVLLHEALGVTDYTRRVANRLAELGYVTVAPDLFWRIERMVDLAHDESGMTRALELIGQFDPHAGVRDVDAALSYLRSRPDVSGPVGVIGFCFGGGLAYGAACELDPACVVAYYGVGAELLAERIDEVTCPTLLHFGTDDVFITPDAREGLQLAAGAKANIEIDVYEGAGHAFDNPHADWHHPDAADRAWDRTAAFLAAHLSASS